MGRFAEAGWRFAELHGVIRGAAAGMTRSPMPVAANIGRPRVQKW